MFICQGREAALCGRLQYMNLLTNPKGIPAGNIYIMKKRMTPAPCRAIKVEEV